VRIRNQTDRRLYGVLLHLTDGFQARANLFAGDFLEPGEVAVAQGGRPVRFALPPGRPPTPGASTTGWLKLIVADHPFDSAALNLPGPGTTPAPGFRPAPWTRSGVPVEWTTTTLPVVTTVPR
jgi:hypothetical protein